MKPIELERWEPAPDDPRRKVYAGQRTAQEVFEELRYRLEGMGYLPDEYLFMDREWANGREIPRGAEIFCITDYGGSEGIYLDCYAVGRIRPDGPQKDWHLGTYKTLETSLTAMQTLGALGGALTYYAREYIWKNNTLFLSEQELRARKLKETQRAIQKEDQK